MYGIYIRGRKNPILVDDERGKALRADYLVGKLPRRLTIGDWTGESELIRAIETNNAPDPEDSSWSTLDKHMSDNAAYYEEIERDYRADRDKRLHLTVEERAKNMRIPSIVWQAHTGQKTIPDHIEREIEERQVQYFHENPKQSYANPICYRDIMKREEKPNTMVWHTALMRLAERMVGTDKSYSFRNS